MTEQTLAAVYDTNAHAEATMRDLEAAGVAAFSIGRHVNDATAATPQPAREPGFWASLFGDETPDIEHYERHLAACATVLTVKVEDAHAGMVAGILERHGPIDFGDGSTRVRRYPAAVSESRATPGAGAA